MAIDLLETTICEPGSPFIVDETTKDTTYIPGSLGYISKVLGPECTCPNVMFYNTYISRRGKKGKARVEQAMILAPIFKLPGVPLSFLVPENKDRKYFVDITVGNIPRVLSEKRKHMGLSEYVSHLLAKSVLLFDLDKVSNPINHPLTDKIGASGMNQRVWPNNKSLLDNFRRSAMDMYANKNFDALSQTFGQETGSIAIITSMANIESALALPMLEYRVKVNQVAIGALKYILEKLNSAEGKALKKHEELRKLTKNTLNAAKSYEVLCNKQIDKRMGKIYSNRKKVAAGQPF